MGGIGTALFPTLYQYLQDRQAINDEQWEVWIFDGDKYEQKNAKRQFVPNGGEYPVNQNKAEATVDALSKQYPELRFRAITDYLNETNTNLIKNGDILLIGVDNDKSRKLVSDIAIDLDNIAVISGGNDYDTGDVLMYHRRDGQELLEPLTTLPQIAEPDDHHPDEGCDLLTESTPQLSITNASVAAKMRDMLYSYLENNKFPGVRVIIDVKSGFAKTIEKYQ